LSLVETDAFCDCGYNLHGQAVWRDERLDLLVCRCPECGRHAAAGRFTGIHSVWLQRLSTGLIASWVGFLLATFLFLTVMLGVWPAVHAGNFLRMRPIPHTGPVPTPYAYDVRALSDWEVRGWGPFVATMYGFATLTGLIIGTVAATCLWHLRWRAFLTLLLPVASVGFIYVLWSNSELTAAAQTWLNVRLGSYVVVEGAAVITGILIGRPVARFLLRLLLPDRLLQHLAFLWYRDGKTPPPLSPKE
jgi:hypothetical protein